MRREFSRKVILSVLTVGVLTTSLVGCGKKATVESIFTESKSAYKDVKSVDMLLDMNIDGSIAMEEDTSMDLALKANLGIKSENEKGSYCSGTVNISMLGMSQEIGVNTYAVLDEDTQTTYSYDSESDIWSKSSTEVDSESLSTELIQKLNDIDYTSIYDKLTLADKTEEFNGVEAYHISGDINGSDLKDAISQIKDVLGEEFDTEEFEKADLSSIVVSTDFYFSKEDSKLLSIKMDFSKTDFAKLMTDSSSEDSDEVESTNTSVSFDDFYINITINDTNNYTFEIPSDVVDSAVDESELEQEYDYEYEDSTY